MYIFDLCFSYLYCINFDKVSGGTLWDVEEFQEGLNALDCYMDHQAYGSKQTQAIFTSMWAGNDIKQTVDISLKANKLLRANSYTTQRMWNSSTHYTIADLEEKEYHTHIRSNMCIHTHSSFFSCICCLFETLQVPEKLTCIENTYVIAIYIYIKIVFFYLPLSHIYIYIYIYIYTHTHSLLYFKYMR